MTTAGQRRLLELLMETRELDPEVIAAVELLLKEDLLEEEQVVDLVSALMEAEEDTSSGQHVGGIIRG